MSLGPLERPLRCLCQPWARGAPQSEVVLIYHRQRESTIAGFANAMGFVTHQHVNRIWLRIRVTHKFSRHTGIGRISELRILFGATAGLVYGVLLRVYFDLGAGSLDQIDVQDIGKTYQVKKNVGYLVP